MKNQLPYRIFLTFVCIMLFATCESAINGSLCDRLDCGEQGTCDETTGKCICNEYYSGVACSQYDICAADSIDCNKRGDCSSGSCLCDNGYYGTLCELNYQSNYFEDGIDTLIYNGTAICTDGLVDFKFEFENTVSIVKDTAAYLIWIYNFNDWNPAIKVKATLLSGDDGMDFKINQNLRSVIIANTDTTRYYYNIAGRGRLDTSMNRIIIDFELNDILLDTIYQCSNQYFN